MNSLLEWLGAQLDEDERIANDRARLAGDVWTAVEIAPGRWDVIGSGGRGVIAQGLPRWEAKHIARWDPASVLAEVDAKRSILDLHAATAEGECTTCGNPESGDYPCVTVRLLALPYAGRPGYRPGWRP